MTKEDKYLTVLVSLQSELGFKLHRAEDSKLIRKFVKKNFGITLLNHIFLPEHWDSMSPRSRVALLLHEAQHVRQQLRFGFGNIYLGFVLQALIYLLFPLPVGLAYGRARLEMDAYKETLRGYYLMSGKDLRVIADKDLEDFIISQFTGPNYVYMWPFERSLRSWYNRAVSEVVEEERDDA